MSSDDLEIVDRAVWACGELGPEAIEMLPALYELVEDLRDTHVYFGFAGVIEAISQTQ